MMLLATHPAAELPAEALLARLRARRAALSGVPGDGGGLAWLPELDSWVVSRLNRRLRRELAPVLELLALRTLVLALRHALAGTSPPDRLRDDPLPAPALMRLTTGELRGVALVERLESTLLADCPYAAGLVNTWRRQGPGGVEQQLVAGVLRQGLYRNRTPVVRGFLRRLIDLRNGLAVARHWDWQLSSPPQFLPGGIVAPETLLRVWSAGPNKRLAMLLQVPEASVRATALEHALLVDLTRWLRRAGRDPLGVGVILDTLWRARLVRHDRTLEQARDGTAANLAAEVLLS